MNAAERRKGILEALQRAEKPLSATALAREYGVSRQIVVGDVALLRAAGEEISSTPRGYLLSHPTEGMERTVVCSHTAQQTQEELYAIVDQGGTVVDVAVDHPVYGRLVGQLQLSSRYDVNEFIRRSAEAKAKPLCGLTQGVHTHTVRCPSQAVYQRVLESLRVLGILIEET